MRRIHTWLPLIPPLAALAVVLVACGGGSTGGAPGEPEAPFGLESRVPVAPLAFPDTLPTPGAVDLDRAFSNLTFQRPVFLTAAPDGTDWLYVLEQGGRILVFPNDDAVTAADTFLDLSAPLGPVSRASNEEGLLGIAFDPDYGSNGLFWVHYSAANPRRSVLARYTATFPSGLAPTAQASSAVVVLEVPQPYSNHNAGTISFGPDDMLYMGLGDGGSGDDPDGNGQDKGTLLGSMLRLDVRGQATYAIPTDNPFVAQSGARGEAWAYGLRNPWRFSFDRDTGDLWLGDVGQGAREEVARVRRGQNHGWPVYEGTRQNRAFFDPPDEPFVPPVVDYVRADGTTVVGGYVYRGQDVPSLRGAYVYGDYGSGRIWALVHDGVSLVSNAQIQSLSQVASFGEDERGELYAVSLGGTLWRFAEPGGGTPPAAFPARLSDTGLFSDTAALVPAPGLVPYDVNAPLWSDGAGKARWIALPGSSVIGFPASGAPYVFPRGTVLVKHFELELRVGDPSSVKRLETRVLVNETPGWRGYTYRWNDAGTDADLLPDGLTVMLDIEDPAAPGGVRTQRYDFPSRTDCLRCHTDATGGVLGVSTLQLHRDYDYAAATDNQLRAWNHIGLFDRDIGSPAGLPALVDPTNPNETTDARARSYLDANCAMCHQPGAPAPGGLDLRFLISESAMNVVDVRPTEGALGLPDAWRVRSGDHTASVLWERMRLTNGDRMPPLSSHIVDQEAVDLLGDWIDSR